jgi:hypothetical protein
VYVIPKDPSSTRDKILFQNFMNKQHKPLSSSTLDALFTQQQYKYIKLFSSANPQIAQDIKNLKNPDPKI